MVRKHETKTVLLIEDDTAISEAIISILELEGHHTICAHDGEEGLRLLRGNPVSVVLLDLKLPKRDGWSVLKEIKESPELSATPVIILTASAGVPQAEKAISVGAFAYIVKPLSAAQLKEVVARASRGEKTE